MPRKAVLAVAVAVAASLGSARPARACPDADLVGWLTWPFAVAVVGGYVGGTAAYVYHDLQGGQPSMDYATGELAFNGVMATAYGFGMASAIEKRDAAALLVTTAMTGLHGSLALHGARRIGTAWHPRKSVVEWTAGMAYVTDTLLFASELGSDHGRGYGAFEATLHAPMAAGLGWLAYDELRAGKRGPAMLFGGMAVISGAFAYHGLRTAIAPRRVPALDLLGTDVTPTIVDDGREVGAGLGAAGTW